MRSSTADDYAKLLCKHDQSTTSHYVNGTKVLCQWYAGTTSTEVLVLSIVLWYCITADDYTKSMTMRSYHGNPDHGDLT